MAQPLQETVLQKPATRPKAILAVEHGLERAGYSAALNLHAGIDLVHSVGDSKAALEAMSESRANILIVDRELRALGGLRTLYEAARRFPETCLMLIADRVNIVEAKILLTTGSRGIGLVNKSMFREPEEFSTAVAVVASGRILLNPAITQWLASGKDIGPLRDFTDREMSVLDSVSSGLSNRAIAARLNLSQRTVENHLSRILEKLGARGHADQHGRVQAVLHFLKFSGQLRDN